jgi:uracil-DNA glycosylase family 4
MSGHSLVQTEAAVPRCRRCADLRAYCADVATTKVKRFADQAYWGKPVPGFGDHDAKIVIVGLAPAAHGANRTGRMFTGDRSGDFLYAALNRAGLANQPHAVSRDDGLRLTNVYITAALRCAPPGNKPTPVQLRNCEPYLLDELRLILPCVIMCLGGIAWSAALTAMNSLGHTVPRPRPKFGHALEVSLGESTLLGCYHVSQQNTFTGRLTPEMIDAVLHRAKALAAADR